jgi:hypothetical protein
MNRTFTYLIAILLGVMPLELSSQQLMNLDPVTSPRFTVTEKTWPGYHGQADVCLWQDDKLAAFTVTIDDNNEQNIPFWEEMHSTFGFNFTWFVINQADDQYNVKDWSKFVSLANAGHAVDGHDDRNWYDEGEEPEGWTNPTDQEYFDRLSATKNKIDTELAATPNKCRTYAYPFGDGNENVARQIFIGIRGVTGLLNKANEINYLDVNSISSPHIAADPAKYILPLIDTTQTLYNTHYYRGWGSTHFHAVDAQADQDAAEVLLQYLKDREDKIWVSTFQKVVAYSQSYVTSTLNVTSVSDNEIKFTLSDEMNDTYFNFPLTIKVRVNNTWTAVSATQAGSAVEAKLITNDNGDKYVLVNAVPDAGETVVTGTVDSGSNNPPVLDPIGDQSVVEGETKTVTITATDPDAGSSLSFSASNLPSFASLTDNGDGTATLTITPSYGDEGIYNNISAAVSDGTDSDSEGFIITVEKSSTQVVIINSVSEDAFVTDPSVTTTNPNPETRTSYYGAALGMKVGSSDTDGNQNLTSAVIPFRLPAVPEGANLSGASLKVYVNFGREWANTNIDLYGIPFRSTSEVVLNDYYSGDFGNGNGSDTGIADDFFTKNVDLGAKDTPRWEETKETEKDNLLSYIKAQYAAGAKEGDWVFFRLSVDNTKMNGSQFFGISDATMTNKPTLTLLFDSSTKIRKVNSGSVNVYPNPSAGGVFNIDYSGFTGDVEVSVFSIQGSRVYGTDLNGNGNRALISTGLPAGTYILKIQDKTGYAVKKLIVR